MADWVREVGGGRLVGIGVGWILGRVRSGPGGAGRGVGGAIPLR